MTRDKGVFWKGAVRMEGLILSFELGYNKYCTYFLEKAQVLQWNATLESFL